MKHKMRVLGMVTIVSITTLFASANRASAWMVIPGIMFGKTSPVGPWYKFLARNIHTISPQDFVDTHQSLKKVKVPYTYYVWETQTKYRWVKKAVTVTAYRWEWQRRKIQYRDWRGRQRTRYVRQKVKVPYTVKTYKTVKEPYTVSVRVKKTGYRYEWRSAGNCL